MKNENSLPSLGTHLPEFAIDGQLLSVSEVGSGHLHRTFLGVWKVQEELVRFVHQEINTGVFPDLEILMRNTDVTLQHLKRCIEQEGTREISYRVVPTRSGRLWFESDEGKAWRTFSYVEGGSVFRRCQNAPLAKEAGLLLGKFLRRMHSLNKQLEDTIPHFVALHRRFSVLEEAVEANSSGRLSRCNGLEKRILDHSETARRLGKAIEEGSLPVWNCHNDPKLENMLFDERTRKGMCLVDLDTVMQSSVAYDFGDLLRSGAVISPEDEKNLASIQVNEDYLEALTAGLLQETGGILSDSERSFMVEAPGAIALTLSARFLSDHLYGDKYFGIAYPDHNLERAKAQFRVYQAFCEVRERLRGLLSEG